MSDTASATARRRFSRPRRVLVTILPLLVIGGAMVGAVMLYATKPEAKHVTSAAKPKARLVTVAPVAAAPATLMIEANGTVEAAQSTQLRARVSGQITHLDQQLAPGTRFEKGEVLARLDPSDYALALTKAQTQLDNAKASLQTENGQQAVAKRELALVGNDVSAKERRLALRAPQLATAKANVKSARTAVDRARLDLDRTRVKAPFAGIVTARNASLGDVVSTADTIATVAATDVYWVNASVPVDLLRWLHADNDNRGASPARIHYPDAWGPQAYLRASVLRVQAALETNGRMARVILKVPDPLGDASANGHRLLLGAYVQARIQARLPADSVMIDSSYLHQDNRVWVVTPKDRLDIRTVKVLYRDATRAVIGSGLAPGDDVVTSDLTAPIQAMPLRVEREPSNAPAAAGPPPSTAQAGPADDPARRDRVHREPARREGALDLKLAPGPGRVETTTARRRTASP